MSVLGPTFAVSTFCNERIGFQLGLNSLARSFQGDIVGRKCLVAVVAGGNDKQQACLLYLSEPPI
jgi:hypothetical protein